MKRSLKIVFLAAVLLVTAAEDFAYAYLDPGSGSYIFQMLIAVFLGAIVTIKLYWQKLKHWISSLSQKRTTGSDRKE